MTTNSLNNEILNDLTIKGSTAGTSRSITVKNSDNTNAASSAKIQITSGGANGGDAKAVFSTTASNSCIGLDNSDSDILKISMSSVPETTTTKKFTSGNITRPLQPAFYAYVTGDIANVTGNSTWYTVVFSSERIDIGSNFNAANGYFTAPISGNYYFSTSCRLSGCSTLNFYRTDIITSDYTYNFSYGRSSGGTYVQNNPCVITHMDSGDTAHVEIIGVGEASKTADLNASSSKCFFCGILLN